MNLLEIRHASYTAGGKTILHELDLAIAEGSLHALIGTNGTGKSTLARLIIGSEGYSLTSGQILFAGRDIGRCSLYQRAQAGMTMVWQEPALFESITVRDYLRLGHSQADLSDCLAQVGLAPDDYLHRPLDKTMSGGERKRIELAAMLALRPKFCMLDEPIAGIDLISVEHMLAVITQIKQNGSTILLITHREEVAAIADQASLLCGGKIVMTGPPDRIVEHYKSRHCIVCNGQECGYVA